MTSLKGLSFVKNVAQLHRLSSTILLRKQQQCLSSVRFINSDGQKVIKSTQAQFNVREDESHTYVIGYSCRGFILNNGFRTLGPTIVFPKAVLHWVVPSASRITPAHVSMFCLMEPKIDLLIIGKGDWDAEANTDIIRYLYSKGISTEILPTEQAIATFNMLNLERRVVAAALIPPTNMSDPDDMFPRKRYDPESIDEIGPTTHVDYEQQQKNMRNQEVGIFQARREEDEKEAEIKKLTDERDSELRRKGLIPDKPEDNKS